MNLKISDNEELKRSILTDSCGDDLNRDNNTYFCSNIFLPQPETKITKDHFSREPKKTEDYRYKMSRANSHIAIWPDYDSVDKLSALHPFSSQ